MIGKLAQGFAHRNPVISDQCINSESVCDWDQVAGAENCINRADEEDCVSIWPGLTSTKEEARDVFGRYLTRQKGYLYFVAYGRKFLYCAGITSWAPSLRWVNSL